VRRYMYQCRHPALCAVGEEMETEMPDSQTPIRGQATTFSVNGAKRGDAVLLLYPDELTAVTIRSIGTWVYASVPAVYLVVWYFVFHTIGWAFVSIWFLAGWWAWQALARRQAAKKVAAGGKGVTVIPLDQVTSVQCRKPRKAAGWLGIRNLTVTTADGTEYRFDGLMEQWHAHLATALTAHGREVHVAPETITVMPWATLGEN
jgi:hypothetical protein